MVLEAVKSDSALDFVRRPAQLFENRIFAAHGDDRSRAIALKKSGSGMKTSPVVQTAIA